MSLIKGKQLKDLAVTTSKIAADAITSAKLADNAVVTANITDLNVTTDKLAADAVTAAKLANNAVVYDNFASGLVDTNFTDGVSASDNTIASTKAIKTYVDNVASGLNAKQSVTYLFDFVEGSSSSVDKFTAATTSTLVQNLGGALTSGIIGLSSGVTGDVTGLRVIITKSAGSGANGIYEFTSGAGDTTLDPSSAGLVNGRKYTISTAGSVNWTTIGAANGNVGTVFTYNNASITGSGGAVKENYVLTRTSDLALGESASGVFVHVEEGTYANQSFVSICDTFGNDAVVSVASGSTAFASGTYYEIASVGSAGAWQDVSTGTINVAAGVVFQGNGTTASGTWTGASYRVRTDIINGSNAFSFTRFSTPQPATSNGGLYSTNSGIYIDINGNMTATTTVSAGTKLIVGSGSYPNSITMANFLGDIAGTSLTYNSSTAKIDLGALGADLDLAANSLTTSTTDGNIKLAANGEGLVEVRGNTNSGAIKLNCENNNHGITLKAPAHSEFSGSYSLTLPASDGSNTQVLQTNGSGVLSWVANSGGGSSSTSYSEVLGNGTTTPLGAITASSTPQLVIVGDEQTCTTGTDTFSSYANGDYCIVTANPNSVTGTAFTNSTGITLINASSTSSAVPATQANNAGAIFKIDNISTFGGANINGVKFKKIYTPAANISSAARATLQVHINGLLQQVLGTNTANLHSGLAFQAVNTSATSGMTDTDVTGALTVGTHFLVFANINFDLETDDHILVSYTV